MIKEYAIDEAGIGMELAKDVTHGCGHCLLTKGTILTQNTISQLKRHNIATLFIVVEEEKTPEQIEAIRKEFEQQLARRFSKVGGDPKMQRLQQILLEHYLRRSL